MSRKTESELRARLVAIETVVLAMVAKTVAGASEPIGDAARLLGTAERILQYAADTAAPAEKRAAEDALGSYEEICMRVLAYVAEMSAPEPVH